MEDTVKVQIVGEAQADIGVFGGSGFYSLLQDAREVEVDTPFGAPSDKLTLGTVAGKKVAFLPRHGHDHRFPPAQIPYRANLWAMHSLGVKQILSPCAAGSLQLDIKRGSLVICDQFVNYTCNRVHTFYTGPKAVHISMADPYCLELGRLITETAREKGWDVHPKGTMVVVEGPRFSTKAESSFFTRMGWHVVNMTGYPECVLARELNMCLANITLITDYDSGLDGLTEPVQMGDVARYMAENNEKLKALILAVIEKMDVKRDCGCRHTVDLEELRAAGVLI